MDISIQHEPTRRVAIERRTVPMSDLVAFFDTSYTKVAAAIAAAGAAPDGPAIAWDQVEKFRAAGEHGVRGDFSEVYLTEPSPDGDPALNRTQLVLPLR